MRLPHGYSSFMTELVFKSALEMGRLLKRRKISSKDLLQACLDQYARYNSAVNAVVLTDIDAGKRLAAAADRRYKKGEALGPFDGVPMTAKESFDWALHPSTWGNPKYRNNIAKLDAEALRRMTNQGAVMWGKTNVPLDLADWQSFNEIYGTTNNPWDLTRAPGGSSGGAAAALATGMSALEIGSDIGASIRNPAHYCGVFGHKPTYGVVPYQGHLLPGIVMPSDITVAGPMARSAKDLTAMMDILAGSEQRGIQVKLQRSEKKTLKDFRVAVKLSSTVSEVDQAVSHKILEAAEFLKKRVKKISFEAAPAFTDAEAYEIYITLLRATASRKLTDAEYSAAHSKAAALPHRDKSYVAMMTRAFALSHRDWLKVNERRHQMRLLWDNFFDEWDVLLCPAAASAAFPHDQVGERHERFIEVNGKRVSTIDQRFWAGYSCGYYLPSTVAPLGLTAQGLPTGVQIITREYGDYTSLKFAELLEQELGGFIAPPGY
jgi:amidase